MSKNEKHSILTRAMINVDKKMGRTPADGEVATPEAKADIKNALIGAGVIVGAVGAFILGFKTYTKATIENEESISTETTEN